MFDNSGRGRGRNSGRGRGGRFSSGRYSGRGGGGGRGGFNNHTNTQVNYPQPDFKVCGDFVKGNCTRGEQCHFAKVIRLLFQVNASDKAPNNENSNGNHGYQHHNSNNNNQLATASDIAVWEKEDGLKIFTASHDEHWRLWNTTNGNLTEEFKHGMGGKIDTLTVAQDFLFCGFEGTSIQVPDVSVGMIHAWNLNSPTDPPIEFHMHDLAPYAHATRVTAFTTYQDMCISGSQDGIIRIWKYDASKNGGKGGFAFLKECSGHAREITGLVIMEKNNMLWSCSTDSTIRLWEGGSNWDCKYLITRDAAISQQSPAPPTPTTGQGTPAVGHSAAITSLVKFESQSGSYVLSSSLDGTIKAWDSVNANCLSTSENHAEGVITMSITTDVKGHPILLCGTEKGKIMIRNLMPTPNGKPAMSLMCLLESKFTSCHYGAVKSIEIGPGHTFYSAGDDGKMKIWQITDQICR